MGHITAQTRIREDVDHVLVPFAALMNRLERHIHIQMLQSRTWNKDLGVSVYKDFGVSAKLAESAYVSRQAKVDAATELAKTHVEDLEHKVSSKKKQIDRKQKKADKLRTDIVTQVTKADAAEAKVRKYLSALEKASSSKRDKAIQRYKSAIGVMHTHRDKARLAREDVRRIDAELHQHRRYLRNLEHRLGKMRKRVDRPSLCFGTRKLFKAQFNLKANGFASHEEWRKAWKEARNATFQIEGWAQMEAGNLFARFRRTKNGLFDLELRLPERLKHLAQETKKAGGRPVYAVHFRGLHFPHNADALAAALEGDTPVSVRFHRDAKGWRVMASFDESLPAAREDYSRGCIGVDLNVGFASVARIDRFGNVVETFDVPMVTYGKSRDQSADIVRKAALVIAAYAAEHGLPVASERLDFARKKAALKEERSARYARMLSSFVYSAFDTALSSALARQGVHHRRVNPAFTSLIGRVKFAPRYGLSVHRAASVAIARRAMKLGEKLPRSFGEERKVTLPLPSRTRCCTASRTPSI